MKIRVEGYDPNSVSEPTLPLPQGKFLAQVVSVEPYVNVNGNFCVAFTLRVNLSQSDMWDTTAATKLYRHVLYMGPSDGGGNLARFEGFTSTVRMLAALGYKTANIDLSLALGKGLVIEVVHTTKKRKDGTQNTYVTFKSVSPYTGALPPLEAGTTAAEVIPF